MTTGRGDGCYCTHVSKCLRVHLAPISSSEKAVFWIVTLVKPQPARSFLFPTQPLFQWSCCHSLHFPFSAVGGLRQCAFRVLLFFLGGAWCRCSKVIGLGRKYTAATRIPGSSCAAQRGGEHVSTLSLLSRASSPPCPSLRRQNGLWYECQLLCLGSWPDSARLASGIVQPRALVFPFPGSGPLLRQAAQNPNFEFVGEAASQARKRKKIAQARVQAVAHSSSPSL